MKLLLETDGGLPMRTAERRRVFSGATGRDVHEATQKAADLLEVARCHPPFESAPPAPRRLAA